MQNFLKWQFADLLIYAKISLAKISPIQVGNHDLLLSLLFYHNLSSFLKGVNLDKANQKIICSLRLMSQRK